MRAHSTRNFKWDWGGSVSFTCRAKSDLMTVSLEKAAALRDAAARSSALLMAILMSSPFSMPTAACTYLPLETVGCLTYMPLPLEKKDRMWN